MALKLNEIFYSVQGEGLEAGLPTVFIRTSGCSLRCTWCDTAYAFWDGNETTVQEVVDHVEKSFPVKRACVTGGEPLDQRESVDLLDALLHRGWEVVLETSGGQPIDRAVGLEPRDALRVSLDVKLPSSGMQGRNIWANFHELAEHDQVKFVIADEDDYAYALDVLEEHGDTIPCEVVFQPVWGQDPCWLAERVLDEGLDVRVSLQLHKVIWGEEPGR